MHLLLRVSAAQGLCTANGAKADEEVDPTREGVAVAVGVVVEVEAGPRADPGADPSLHQRPKSLLVLDLVRLLLLLLRSMHRRDTKTSRRVLTVAGEEVDLDVVRAVLGPLKQMMLAIHPIGTNAWRKLALQVQSLQA